MQISSSFIEFRTGLQLLSVSREIFLFPHYVIGARKSQYASAVTSINWINFSFSTLKLITQNQYLTIHTVHFNFVVYKRMSFWRCVSPKAKMDFSIIDFTVKVVKFVTFHFSNKYNYKINYIGFSPLFVGVNIWYIILLHIFSN